MLKFGSNECGASNIGHYGTPTGPGYGLPQLKFTPIGFSPPTGAFFYLPAPMWGSTIEMQGKNPLIKTRGLTPKQITRGKVNYKLIFTFGGLYERLAEEANEYFINGIGLESTLLDHRSDTWTVIHTQVPEFIQHGDNNFAFTLEMEANSWS